MKLLTVSLLRLPLWTDKLKLIRTTWQDFEFKSQVCEQWETRAFQATLSTHGLSIFTSLKCIFLYIFLVCLFCFFNWYQAFEGIPYLDSATRVTRQRGVSGYRLTQGLLFWVTRESVFVSLLNRRRLDALFRLIELPPTLNQKSKT